jgi:hypothetical protein
MEKKTNIYQLYPTKNTRTLSNTLTDNASCQFHMSAKTHRQNMPDDRRYVYLL